MKYAASFVLGLVAGTYLSAWILGVWMQATPERTEDDSYTDENGLRWWFGSGGGGSTVTVGSGGIQSRFLPADHSHR